MFVIITASISEEGYRKENPVDLHGSADTTQSIFGQGSKSVHLLSFPRSSWLPRAHHVKRIRSIACQRKMEEWHQLEIVRESQRFSLSLRRSESHSPRSG